MDADAFMGAQLWLRRLPAQAWPTSTTAAAAAAKLGRTQPHNVCRHAFATDAPTGVNIRDDHGVQGGGRVVLEHARCCFLLEDRPSAGTAAGRNDDNLSTAPEEAGTAGRSTAMNNTSGSDRTNALRRRRPRPLYFSTSNATTNAKRDTDGRNGSSPVSKEAAEGEHRAGRASKARRNEEGKRVSFPGSTSSAEEQAPVSLRREFDFGLAIARGSTPPSEAEPDGTGGGRPPVAEEGGALLLRIEGEVYEAEHTLIRSIAYPRGDAGGGSRGDGFSSDDTRGARPHQAPPGAATRGVATRNDDSIGPNRGGGGDDEVVRERGGPLPMQGKVGAVPPIRSAPAEHAAAAGPKVAGGKRSIDACKLDGAADGPVTRREGRGKRGCFHSAGGNAGRAGRGTPHATAAAAVVAARESSRGGEEVEAGMPFCGLFFPGVLLKFWLPRRHGEARTEAVARLQGVVNAMLAGLSSTPRCERPTSSGVQSSQELDRLVSSAVAEGQGTGFRLRYEAWDEFAHGSHFFLRQERRSSDRMGTDAPLLPDLPANGESDALLGGGVLSDVGRARALTSLAGCFREACLPSPVRLRAQRRVRVTATSASWKLESALDQAFPLDLSQEADSNTRVSMASELEASLRRVQQTRKSLLALSILPASDALDE